MVLAVSEFSSGRHWHTNLPMIFAGNFGNAQMGRWLNHLNYPVDEAQVRWIPLLWIQCLSSFRIHATGFWAMDDTFGYTGDSV